MLWTRPKPVLPSTRIVGVDLTASRAHLVSASGGIAHFVGEVPLVVDLASRTAASVPVRKEPHRACVNFLAQLGLPREWRGKHTLTPELALAASFDAVRYALHGVGQQFALTLPEYLSPSQVRSVVTLATQAKLTITATCGASLAIAAHRADGLLAPNPPRETPEWVVPMKSSHGGGGVAVIVDADEGHLFASTIEVTTHETRHLASAAWPRAGIRLWKDKLIDALSDRCVRLCRRDPRDSADAEQGLYDQLPEALARSRQGHTVTLAARADKWYQDLTVSPADLEQFTASIASIAIEGVKELIVNAPAPPRAVWLSHAAAQLPGLANGLYDVSPEGCDVAVLPPSAAAEAAAMLDARVRAGELDSVIGGIIPNQKAIPEAQRSTEDAQRMKLKA